MGRVRIAPLDAVPEGGNKAFDVEGKSVLVCRISSGLFAVENVCSHAASCLEGGKMKGPFIFCPLHGVRFDLRTGAPSGTLTRKPIAVYPLALDEDHLFADLPDA